jgi:hypothetical protein
MTTRSFIAAHKVAQDFVNQFKRIEMVEFTNFVSKKFDLSFTTVQIYFQNSLSNHFYVQQKQFSSRASFWRLPFSLLEFYYFLFAVLFNSKSGKIHRKQKFRLLIDQLDESKDFGRWQPLIDVFGANNCVFITKLAQTDKVNCIIQQPLKKYRRETIQKHVLRALTIDAIKLFILSVKTKQNFIHFYTRFLNDYFYYDAVFSLCDAQYLIQSRNLGRTNAVRNELFRQFGGHVSGCLQMHLSQHIGTAMFYDTDVFFSLGKKTAIDILPLGSRIGQVLPVGSLSMLNSLSYEKRQSSKDAVIFDLVYFGINTTQKGLDWSGLYKSLEWLAALSEECPNLKIGIKHHATWPVDEKELQITRGSRVKYIDKEENSYQIGLSAKLCCTYGSTMGLEFIGHQRICYFIDPLGDSTFVNRFIKDDNLIIESYDQFRETCKGVLEGEIKKINVNPEDYCLSTKAFSQSVKAGFESWSG